jgi:phospholipase/lecithinase/hemolysin
VWVDYLPTVAQALGVQIPPATAYFLNRTDENATDFAIAGATSGEFSVSIPGLPGFQQHLPIGFLAQVCTYLTSVNQQASAADLYVIWVGANDFAAQMQPEQTVANIKNGIWDGFHPTTGAHFIVAEFIFGTEFARQLERRF